MGSRYILKRREITDIETPDRWHDPFALKTKIIAGMSMIKKKAGLAKSKTVRRST